MDLDQDILVRNGYIDIPSEGRVESILYAAINLPVATIVSNLASYGYVVDRRAFDALLMTDDISRWWKPVEKILKDVTGADRNMDEHIVYKNFPREVLDMTLAGSVIRQILIYMGVPYDAVREEEQERPPLGDIKRLKVLTLADENTPNKIFTDLMGMRNRWSDNQTNWASKLVKNRNAIVCGEFGFKENAITLAVKNFDTMEFEASSATDVLRLAAGLSQADISLREKVRFRHFNRPERRRLMGALESQKLLAEDMAARPGVWKRLLEHLRPGDYRDSTPSYPAVMAAYDGLYRKQVKSFAARVDPQTPTLAVLEALAERPGEFMRAFHRSYTLFGKAAVEHFIPVMDKLTTRQLAGFRAYIRTITDRTSLIYAPRSNWARSQVVLNEKKPISPTDRRTLDSAITQILSKRLAAAYPEGIALDLRIDQVRLQSNDQKLAEYGRGTEFDIPVSVTFIRSASYWESPHDNVVWFDNGWNLFGEDWVPKGACCWNSQIHGGAAVFSGDPVNTRDLRGRACQMVDLYLDRLDASGVRYAVWNLLCYSRVKFSQATEVLATLQMGDHAEKGKTYEPSRAQMVFPIKSDTMTNYVAYLDIRRRKLVYMDAALPGFVHSANQNCVKLSTIMPAYLEYLAAQPTLLEILQDAPSGKMPVLFDDTHTRVREGRAYVFRPTNSENSFDRLSLTDLLNV